MPQSALRALDQAYMMGMGQGPAPARVPKTRGQTTADILGAASLPMSAVPIAGDLTGLAADAAMYAAYPEQRTMGNYAMSALGALPLIPGAAAVRAMKNAPQAGNNTQSADSRAYQLAEDSDEDGLYSITAYTDDDAFVVADANTDGTFSIKESGVPEQLRGSGVGIGLYESLLGDAFKRGAPKVASDVSVSKEAQRIYSALQRRGYNVQQNPSAVIDPDSGALFAEGGVYTIMPASAAPSPLEGTLDMSPSARMQRAAEQGFDERVFYHGGSSEFDEFAAGKRGNYFSDDPRIADIYAANAEKRRPGTNNAFPNVIPVQLKGPSLVVSDQQNGDGGWYQDNLAKILGVDLYALPTVKRPQALRDEAKKQGYGFIEIRDMSDLGGTQTQFVSLDTSNIRSTNAAFDPAKRGSGNLMAGAAGATIGLSALRNIQRDEEPQRRPD